MSVALRRCLLFFMCIMGIPIRAQLPCCQVQSVGSFFPEGLDPRSIAISPNGTCLAAASGDDSVFILPINPDCSLGQESFVNLALGSDPQSVVFSPDGTCLAVANAGNNTISMFQVDLDMCILSPVLGNPFDISATSISPQSVAFSPDGSCLAVASLGPTPNVSLFAVDPDTCVLNTLAADSEDTQADPVSVAFSPNGNCLAVANSGASSISVFSVNNCTLTPVGMPISTGPDSNPSSVAFSPNGTCLAVANSDSDNVSVFTVDPETCALTQVDNSPFLTGGEGPSSLAFSSDGSCLAVANQDSSNVSLFAVDGACSLTPIQNSPVSTGPGTTPSAVAYSINGCLAVANSNDPGSIALFSPLIVPQPIITSTLVTNCNIVTVTGTAVPDATVTLFADGDPTPVGSGPTDEAGNFSIVTSPLSAGTHSITAVTTLFECNSIPSVPVTVTIITPTITSISVACGNFLTVIGTSIPNTSITLAVDDVSVATGVTNANGIFVIAGIVVPSGFHCLTATDTTNGCTGIPVCVTVTTTPCVLAGPNLAFNLHCCKPCP